MNSDIISKLKTGPEQQLVIGPLVQRLLDKGWRLGQMMFGRTEWRVPKTPSEASKRESGSSYAVSLSILRFLKVNRPAEIIGICCLLLRENSQLLTLAYNSWKSICRWNHM